MSDLTRGVTRHTTTHTHTHARTHAHTDGHDRNLTPVPNAISVSIKMLSSSSYGKPNRVYSTKLRWDRADLSQYQDVCSSMLAQIHLPIEALLCSCSCCTIHNSDLENYYNSIIDCLLSGSSLCVPGAKTVVRRVYGNSKSFEVKVGMHQGSALRTLLFVIIVKKLNILKHVVRTTVAESHN